MTRTYRLTKDAEVDLDAIIKYTLKEWGDEQAIKYGLLLDEHFQGIANNRVPFRTFSKKYPQLRVTHCEHHYVFYFCGDQACPIIIAVLHERMDLLSRLRDRLDG